MTDVIYIVGNGSTHDNAELRYSLRALAKYGRNVGRVIVAGVPPAFLSAEVEKIDIEPVALRGRNRTITNNVIEGVMRSGLRGDFILGIDDVFLTEQMDLDEYPRYFDAYDLRREGTGGWFAAMRDTREWLVERKLPTVDFMTHAHVRMDADIIRDNFGALRNTVTDTTRGLEITTLVGNLYLASNPRAKLTMREDIKTAERFPVSVPRPMFSCSDKTFDDPAFMRFLESEYPEPSKWEVSP